jgi:hypothetical protein
MVFALVFVMFASHQALSEQDYHEDKEKLLTICWDIVKIDGAYVPPIAFCRYFVKKKLIWLLYAVYLTQLMKLQQVRLNLFILLMIVARHCSLEANAEISTYIFVPMCNVNNTI